MTNILSSSPFTTLEVLVNQENSDAFRKFFTLLKDPCEDPEEDCGDILSTCCAAPLKTVFGSLPLEVKCSACDKTYLLRDLAQKSLTPI